MQCNCSPCSAIAAHAVQLQPMQCNCSPCMCNCSPCMCNCSPCMCNCSPCMCNCSPCMCECVCAHRGRVRRDSGRQEERDNEKNSPPRRSDPWARAPGGAASSPLCSGTSSTAQCAGGHCIHKQTYQQSHQPGTVTVTVTAVVTASTKHVTRGQQHSVTLATYGHRELNRMFSLQSRGGATHQQTNK